MFDKNNIPYFVRNIRSYSKEQFVIILHSYFEYIDNPHIDIREIHATIESFTCLNDKNLYTLKLNTFYIKDYPEIEPGSISFLFLEQIKEIKAIDNEIVVYRNL